MFSSGRQEARGCRISPGYVNADSFFRSVELFTFYCTDGAFLQMGASRVMDLRSYKESELTGQGLTHLSRHLSFALISLYASVAYVSI